MFHSFTLFHTAFRGICNCLALPLASGYLVPSLIIQFTRRFHISLQFSKHSFNSEFTRNKIRRAFEVLQASALKVSITLWRTKAMMRTMCPFQQSYRLGVVLERPGSD